MKAESNIDVLRALLNEVSASSTAGDSISEPTDWSKAIHDLYQNENTTLNLTPEIKAQLRFLDHLGVLTNTHPQLMKHLAHACSSSRLTDLATDYYDLPLQLNSDCKLTTGLIKGYQTRLFAAEPTAVLRGFVKRDSIPTVNVNVKTNLLQLFDLAVVESFDITRTSARELLTRFQKVEATPTIQSKADDLLSKNAAKLRKSAVDVFQTIQRLQAVVTNPDQIGHLISKKLISAQSIAAKDLETVKELLKDKIDAKSIGKIYNHAGIIDARNEQAWVKLLQTRSQGFVAASPPSPSSSSQTQQDPTKPATASPATGANASTVTTPVMGDTSSSVTPSKKPTKQTISLETLFQEVDTASCEHCNSVLSPSAYYVDLLRMLEQRLVNTGETPTLKDKLFERRADLGALELSCANTNNLIPYVDLVHEVLQSFAISLSSSAGPYDTPIPVTDARNKLQEHRTDISDVERDIYFDHNLHAMFIRKQVYPVHAFPYNLANDTIERFLKAAGTSRLEIARIFRADNRIKNQNLGSSDGAIAALSEETWQRTITAYQLGLSAEEYVLLTGEGLVSKRALELTQGALSWEQYRLKAGQVTVGTRWGYNTDSEMLDESEDTKVGLTFVQKQLLPRSGLKFQELVDILQTQFLGRRLVLTPAKQAERFNGKLDDFRLRASTVVPESKGSLTSELCANLLAFVRLYRKLKWSITDLDTAISYIQRTNPPTPLRGGSGIGDTGITPEILDSLSAIQSIKEESSLTISTLMPLWGDMDMYGPNSLYSTLFIKRQLFTADQKLFKANKEGKYFTSMATLSNGYATLTTALGLTTQELQDVVTASTEGKKEFEDPWLNLASISRVYRYFILCRVFNISPSQLGSFLKLQGGSEGWSVFDSPRTMLEALIRWKAILNSGYSADSLIAICSHNSTELATDVSTQLQPQTLQLLNSSLSAEPYLLAARNEAPNCDEKMIRILLQDILVEKCLQEGSVKSASQALKSAYDLAATTPLHRAYLTVQTSGDYTLFSANESVENKDQDTVIFKINDNAVGNATKNSITLNDLQCGQTYVVESSADLRSFGWKSPQSLSLAPLQDCLISDEVVKIFATVVRKLTNITKLITASGLDEEEVRYFSQTRSLGPSLDFNNLNLSGIETSTTYSRLRDSLNKGPNVEKYGLLHYLRWLNSTDTPSRSSLASRLARVTGFQASIIDEILTEGKFSVSDFANLTRLQQLLDILSFSTHTKFRGSDLSILFELADSPLYLSSLPSISRENDPNEDPQFQLADKLRELMRELLVSPAQTDRSPYGLVLDGLVEGCRGALVQYLLNHEYIRSRSLEDADALFEYFLIDVQMGSGLKTSRMKQAISTVQLYVQRCLLGLEVGYGVHSDTIKQDHWSWMRSYQLWEANRKVFLYPENWIDPTLRDDKSDLFKELEAKIMQSNLDTETISQIVKSYVYGVNEVADLEVQAYLWDTQNTGQKIFHLFSRTRNAPYVFYYRKLTIFEQTAHDKVFRWAPWQKMDLEIPTFEVKANGKSLKRTGSYLLPTIRKKRVFLFMPQIMLKTAPSSSLKFPKTATNETSSEGSGTNDSNETSNPTSNTVKYWEVRMGWSELRNGQWAAKRVSQAFLHVKSIPIDKLSKLAPLIEKKENLYSLDETLLPEIDSFKFWIRSAKSDGAALANATGVQDILNIDMETWIMSEPNTGLMNTEKSQFKTINYPLGRFQMREYDISVVQTDKMTNGHEKSGIPTVPTRFAKLEWEHSGATEEGMSKWKPENSVVHGRDENKPLLAKVTSKSSSKSLRQMTWTMSFDDSQAKQPTGLIVDMTTRDEGNRSFLVLPALDINAADNGAGVIHTINNELAPFFMERATSVEGLDLLYDDIATKVPTGQSFDAFGLTDAKNYHELTQPFAIYNWELGFHIVSLLMERLLATQQLELALQIARYVFNPSVSGDDLNRCWRFPPFASSKIHGDGGAVAILDSLKQENDKDGKPIRNPTSAQLDTAVMEWRAQPFAAHVMARNWPVAYMKRIVRKYIEILIASGDEYFRQGTLESMPLAIQRYIEASHLFGARPKTYPRIGKSTPRSFNDLTGKLNSFSTTTVDMELDFPFVREPNWRGNSPSATSTPSAGQSTGPASGLLGFVRTGYFCIPANPDLTMLRDLIDDRLYKIRNCQDINGRGVTLRLWEPSLDPGALVQATAAGLSISSFLAEASGPMPNFRFQYLLQKAFELCGELKGMGDQYLAIKEKRDSEALSSLRSAQEIAVNTMLLDVKKLQLEEATKSLESLEATRRSHETRLSFYLRLIGEEDQIPPFDQEWQEIQQNIDKPTVDDLRMSNNEKQEFELANEAAAINMTASTLETVASGLLALPRLEENVDPMGMGVSIQFDASNIAHYMMGTASVMKLLSQMKSDQGARAARKAQLIRQLQERRLQANLAGRDINQIDKQIAAQKVRIKMSQSEINLQQKQIDHSREMDQWCRTKYTNEKLYAWMDSSYHRIYQDTYLMAVDLARKAKKAYDFERGIASGNGTSNFIKDVGYWDKSRDGLLSAQSLYLDLKRMETAYIERRAHHFELTKSISLRQIDPIALLKLRVTGEVTFSIPELLFDLDFPGHYLRRIKNVSLSVPCVIGPYTSVNCSLELVKHTYRIKPDIRKDDGSDYTTPIDRDDPRLSSDSVPIKSVAASNCHSDSGVFEVQFNGDRYLPFEGAGVISEWKLQLPPIRQFDYNTISDVVLQINYTALDGGSGFRDSVTAAARKSLTGVWGSKMYALFDIANDFTQEWLQAKRPIIIEEETKIDPETKGVIKVKKAVPPALLQLRNLEYKLPFWTAGKSVTATTTSLLVSYSSTASSCPKIAWAASPATPFAEADPWNQKTRNPVLLKDAKHMKMNQSWTFSIPRNGTGRLEIDRLFMIVEYQVDKFE